MRVKKRGGDGTAGGMSLIMGLVEECVRRSFEVASV